MVDTFTGNTLQRSNKIKCIWNSIEHTRRMAQYFIDLFTKYIFRIIQKLTPKNAYCLGNRKTSTKENKHFKNRTNNIFTAQNHSLIRCRFFFNIRKRFSVSSDNYIEKKTASIAFIGRMVTHSLFIGCYNINMSKYTIRPIVFIINSFPLHIRICFSNGHLHGETIWS